MLHVQQMEFLVRERHQHFLDEAEQRRLTNELPLDGAGQSGRVQPVLKWCGSQCVRWGICLIERGLQLQGLSCDLTSPQLR